MMPLNQGELGRPVDVARERWSWKLGHLVKKRMNYEEDSRRNLTGDFDGEICQFILTVNTGESSQSFC